MRTIFYYKNFKMILRYNLALYPDLNGHYKFILDTDNNNNKLIIIENEVQCSLISNFKVKPRIIKQENFAEYTKIFIKQRICWCFSNPYNIKFNLENDKNKIYNDYLILLKNLSKELTKGE